MMACHNVKSPKNSPFQGHKAPKKQTNYSNFNETLCGYYAFDAPPLYKVWRLKNVDLQFSVGVKQNSKSAKIQKNAKLAVFSDQDCLGKLKIVQKPQKSKENDFLMANS